MADDRKGKRAPEAGAGAEAPEAPKVKGSLGTILRWTGFFFLSFALVCVAMWFVVQQRLRQGENGLETAAPALETAAADSLAEADSLGLAPEDSLVLRVGELERQVDERQTALTALEDSTSRMAGRMAQMRRELEAMQERELVLSNEEVQKLSRVFESMQPARAAPVLLKMDNASVASILLTIEERSAAKILGAMPPERAAGISALIKQRAEQKAREDARRKP